MGLLQNLVAATEEFSEPTADTYQQEGTGEQCPHKKSFACFYTPIELLSWTVVYQNEAFLPFQGASSSKCLACCYELSQIEYRPTM